MGHDDSNSLSAAFARCRSAFLSVGAFSLIINLLMLTTSIYMLQVFDRVLASHSLETLTYLTLIAASALALLSVLDVTRARILTHTSIWFERRLSPAALARALEAALRSLDYRTESLRDLGSLRGFLGGTGILALFDTPWVPVYLAFVYLLHPLLGHIALAGAVILFALALINDRVTHSPLREANDASTKALRATEASLRNAEAIDAMHLLPGITRRWQREHWRALDRQAQAGDRAGLVLGASRFCRLFVQVAVLGTGAWLVVRHELTSGAMIAASIIMGRALAPVEQAIGAWKQAVEAREAHRRLQTFFARPRLRPEALRLPPPRGYLAVESISYALPGAIRPILRGASFAVRPGEALAVVGPSAAGKSTLARLLVGTREPSAGTVRLDGADVFAWPRDDIGRHIGYLPQDVELFAGSVAQNVARMNEGDPAEIVRAAQVAQAHEMILRLPQGYATEIGEQGAFLSGGQRQRIALARALFGEPKLIVLDEPNANLDGEGEEALNQAIAAMKRRGAAVVVIGHRPSILAQVDKVLVLVDGQVEQLGPRTEILERLTRRNLAPVPNAGSPDRPAPASAPTTAAIHAAE
jgi:PrtD family type I secretion system ABC transporter